MRFKVELSSASGDPSSEASGKSSPVAGPCRRLKSSQSRPWLWSAPGVQARMAGAVPGDFSGKPQRAWDSMYQRTPVAPRYCQRELAAAGRRSSIRCSRARERASPAGTANWCSRKVAPSTPSQARRADHTQAQRLMPPVRSATHSWLRVAVEMASTVPSMKAMGRAVTRKEGRRQNQ
jgi:hypothetical protein